MSAIIINPYRFAAAAAPTPDVLWWKFTDGSGTTVTATVGPNGTLAGGATWVTGKSGSGYAVQFDGTDDALYSASNVTYGASTITITAWVYWDSFANDGDFLFESTASADANDNTFFVMPNGNRGTSDGYLLTMLTGTNYYAPYWTRFTAATWTHIAIVLDNTSLTGVVKVYYDGALQTAAGTYLNVKNSTANFVAGVLNVFSRNNTSGFGAGRIDDLRIYARELNATEVGQVYAEAM